MAKRNAKKASVARKTTTAGTKKERSPAQLAVHAAGKITGDLISSLQNARKTFLRIGQLLTEVRERKYYETLHHKDLAEYTLAHLGLSRTATYRYMQVYEWALANHPEWLDPAKKVRIPELTQVVGAIWADQELAKGTLEPERKTTLETLKEKALRGKLSTTELRRVQKRTNTPRPKKHTAKMLASLRALRKRGERDGESAQLLAAIDHAILVAVNDLAVETAGLNALDRWPSERCRSSCLDHNTRIT